MSHNYLATDALGLTQQVVAAGLVDSGLEVRRPVAFDNDDVRTLSIYYREECVGTVPDSANGRRL